MHIADDYLGIDDYFRITSVTHNINGDIHKMNCTLEYLKEADTTTLTEGNVIQREEIETESESADFDTLYDILNAQVGKPYVWGAVGPNSFDCSGLVYYCFNKAGKKISRLTAQGYYNICTKIKKSERQKGDLIFWSTGGKVTHVAVYIGDGKMIGAQNEKDGVRKMSVYGSPSYGRLK